MKRSTLIVLIVLVIIVILGTIFGIVYGVMVTAPKRRNQTVPLTIWNETGSSKVQATTDSVLVVGAVASGRSNQELHTITIMSPNHGYLIDQSGTLGFTSNKAQADKWTYLTNYPTTNPQAFILINNRTKRSLLTTSQESVGLDLFNPKDVNFIWILKDGFLIPGAYLNPSQTVEGEVLLKVGSTPVLNGSSVIPYNTNLNPLAFN